VSRWHFVRHGQSVANAEGWFSGHIDAALTDQGRAQAEATARAVRAVPIARCVSSDLQRARVTAELILAGRDVPITTTAALRERTCGDWEGRHVTDLNDSGDMPLFTQWAGRPPGGESLKDVAERAMAYLAAVDGADGSTLVAAHGALIRAVVGVIDGTPSAEIGLWRPQNCELITRDLEPGGWDLLLRAVRG